VQNVFVKISLRRVGSQFCWQIFCARLTAFFGLPCIIISVEYWLLRGIHIRQVSHQ